MTKFVLFTNQLVTVLKLQTFCFVVCNLVELANKLNFTNKRYVAYLLQNNVIKNNPLFGFVIVREHDDIMLINIHDIACHLIARGGYLDRPVIDLLKKKAQ